MPIFSVILNMITSQAILLLQLDCASFFGKIYKGSLLIYGPCYFCNFCFFANCDFGIYGLLWNVFWKPLSNNVFGLLCDVVISIKGDWRNYCEIASCKSRWLSNDLRLVCGLKWSQMWLNIILEISNLTPPYNNEIYLSQNGCQ